MTRVFLVALGLLAAGCTTAHLDDDWAKAGAGTQQATYDDWQCRRVEYEKAPHIPTLVLGGFIDAARTWLNSELEEATYRDCMRSRGYAMIDRPPAERPEVLVERGSVKAERTRFTPPPVAPPARAPESP